MVLTSPGTRARRALVVADDLQASPTVAPYVVGAIAALLSGIYADKFRWRMPFICAPLVLVIVAYAILFSKSAELGSDVPLCYFAICLACAGLYPMNPGINA